MSALGLWGTAQPDPGDADRESDEDINRPSSAWAPQRGLWGGLSPDVGTAARALTQVITSTYAERVGVREVFSPQVALSLGSASFLVGELEAFASTIVVERPYSEIAGSGEAFAANKQGATSYAEFIGNRTAYGSIVPGATSLAAYEEDSGNRESADSLKGGLSTFAMRSGCLESWQSVKAITGTTPPFIQTPRDFIRTGRRRRFAVNP